MASAGALEIASDQLFYKAEGVGFEPTRHFCPPVFKTGSIGRSDSPPAPVRNRLAKVYRTTSRTSSSRRRDAASRRKRHVRTRPSGTPDAPRPELTHSRTLGARNDGAGAASRRTASSRCTARRSGRARRSAGPQPSRSRCPRNRRMSRSTRRSTGRSWMAPWSTAPSTQQARSGR